MTASSKEPFKGSFIDFSKLPMRPQSRKRFWVLAAVIFFVVVALVVVIGSGDRVVKPKGAALPRVSVMASDFHFRSGWSPYGTNSV